MVKKISKKEPKYVTVPMFEKGMDFMAKSFKKVFEKFNKYDKKFEQHDKAFETIIKEMQTFNKEAREHRMEMSSLNHTDISQEREIEGLKVRVERLEEKIK